MARTREFDTDRALARAMEVFRERGYEGASTRELGEAMGIGSGSLYAAFGNKGELYATALAVHREHLDATVERSVSSRRGVREILRGLLSQTFDGSDPDHWGPGCLLLRAATERAGRDPKVDRMLRDATEAVQQSFIDMIGRAQRSKEVTSAESPETLAHYLVTMIQGLRVMCLSGSDRRSLVASVELALRCLD
jgi:TetR/AcrR family transcriptional regulator, transcriptional repressor for nem operon